MEAFMKIHVIPCYVSSHMVPATVPLGWPSLKYLLSGPLQRRFAIPALEGGKSELSASVGVMGGRLEKAIRTRGRGADPVSPGRGGRCGQGRRAGWQRGGHCHVPKDPTR